MNENKLLGLTRHLVTAIQDAEDASALDELWPLVQSVFDTPTYDERSTWARYGLLSAVQWTAERRTYYAGPEWSCGFKDFAHRVHPLIQRLSLHPNVCDVEQYLTQNHLARSINICLAVMPAEMRPRTVQSIVSFGHDWNIDEVTTALQELKDRGLIHARSGGFCGTPFGEAMAYATCNFDEPARV